MSSDPSLTPEHDLTDEELATEAGYHQLVPWGGHCQECEVEWPCVPSRIIAALRASREEVDRLRKKYEHPRRHDLYAGDVL